MPTRTLVCLVFVLIFGAHAHNAMAAGCKPLPSEIVKDIKVRVAAIQGYEDCHDRQILTGQIASSRDDDYLVVYDVQDPCFKKKVKPGTPCGNFDLQYWVVYTKTRGKYHAVAASIAPKNRILIDQIQNNSILVHVYTYKPLDPNCCPSVDTLKTYKVINNRIVKVKH